MNKKLRELFAKRSTIATEMRSLMNSNNLDEAEKKAEEIRSLDKQIEMETLLFEEERSQVPTEPQQEKRTESKIEIEKRAIRKILTREQLTEEERASVHLTDSGAVLPQSFSTTIENLRKGYKALKPYCRVIPVTTNTGRLPLSRGTDTKKLANLQKDTELVKEMVSVDPVAYSTSDYGKIVPIDNSVLEDTTTDFLGLVDEEFAENAVNTENYEIIQILKALVNPADGTDYKDIQKAINKLAPVARNRAIIITNSNGYAYLDELVDLEGRPLLKSLTEGGEIRFKTAEVVEVDTEFLPNEKMSDTTTDAIPFYVVDLRKLVMFFDRKGYEIGTSKDAGFTLNQTLVRVLERFDVQKLINNDHPDIAKFAKRVLIPIA